MAVMPRIRLYSRLFQLALLHFALAMNNYSLVLFFSLPVIRYCYAELIIAVSTGTVTRLQWYITIMQ
jgi:hypothetical protein